MRIRVVGITRRSNTQFYWFRMAIPERYRALHGKREETLSLETTDLNEARRKHAIELARMRGLFAQYDSILTANLADEAEAICARGFTVLVRSNLAANDDGVTDKAKALDNVVFGLLKFLAYRVRSSWSAEHAVLAERDLLGEVHDDTLELADHPTRFPVEPKSVVDNRHAFTTQMRLIENHVDFQGLAYREIARSLLRVEDWQACEMEVLLIAHAADVAVLPKSPRAAALAKVVLSRLADHEFQHWPSESASVLSGLPSLEKIDPAPLQTAETAGGKHSLDEAYETWERDFRAKLGLVADEPNKTIDEWNLALRRFKGLIGDLAIEDIRKKHLKAFIRDLPGIPSRAANAIKALPVRDQIERAKKDGLSTLGAKSVQKHLTAISSLLSVGEDEEWITKNPADGIVVPGAGYVGDERFHFTAQELQTLYSSPLMTDPDACSDEMFWLIFAAPLGGARPSEIARLAPNDVMFDGPTPVFRMRRRREGPSNQKRGLKTITSIRDVPIHWILVEGGLMAFAELQLRLGRKWLLEGLTADKYNDRYKTISKAINSRLDAMGLNDLDKAFYSLRHSTKRETRTARIEEHNADQLLGHASGRNVGRKYGQGTSLDILKEDIDKLEYEGVEWDDVVNCAKRRVRRAYEAVKLDIPE